MTIVEARTFSFPEMKELMNQLNPALVVTEEMIQEVIDSPGSHLYLMMDGEKAIGCATLCVFCSPTGRKASIEDVVVLNQYRGRHLGRELVQHLLDQARTWAPITVHLTSRPEREVANRMYQSLGFTRKNTNHYFINIHS